MDTDGPWLLCLETTAETTGVALARGRQLVCTADIVLPHAQKSLLAPLVQQCLHHAGIPAAQLAAVAVAGGPGSYTGLRIGVSLAKGLCAGLGIPLLAVASLHGIAAPLLPLAHQLNASIIPMLDARRMEVYWSALRPAGPAQYPEVLRPDEPRVVDDSFAGLLPEGNLIFCGNGVAKCMPLMAPQLGQRAIFLPETGCSALGIALLAPLLFAAGRFEDMPVYEPAYLKSFSTTAPRQPGVAAG